MIKTIEANGSEKQFLADMKKRSGEVNAEVEKTVRQIIMAKPENVSFPSRIVTLLVFLLKLFYHIKHGKSMKNTYVKIILQKKHQ